MNCPENREIKKVSLTEKPQIHIRRRQTHWLSLYVAAILAFVGNIQLGLYFSSAWPYLQEVDETATENFLGLIIAAFSFGTLLASPIIGYWSDKIGKIKPLLYFCFALMFFGNFLYILAGVMPVGQKYFILLARFVAGLGFAYVTLLRAYAVSASISSDRSKAIAYITGGVALGATTGPALQLIFTPLGIQGYQIFKFLQFNIFTGPAFLACAINIFAYLLVYFYFIERNIGVVDKEIVKQKGVDLPPYDKVATLICYVTTFIQLFAVINIETINGPLAMSIFAFSKTDVVKYTALAELLRCLVAFIMYSCYINLELGKNFNSRKIQIISLALLLLFHFITYSWPFFPGEIQIYNDSDIQKNFNSTDELLGCNIDKYPWCKTLNPINFYIYYIAFIILIGISFPNLNISLNTIFSKIIGPRPQNIQQGWFQVAGSTGRMIGPIAMSAIYISYGPRWSWNIEIFLLAITLGYWILFQNRMIPLEIPKEYAEYHDKDDIDIIRRRLPKSKSVYDEIISQNKHCFTYTKLINRRRKILILKNLFISDLFDPDFDRTDPALLVVNDTSVPKITDIFPPGDTPLSEDQIEGIIYGYLQVPPPRPFQPIPSSKLFGENHQTIVNCTSELLKHHRWVLPIHYAFNKTIRIATRKLIMETFEIIQNQTCLKFKALSVDNLKNTKSNVLFESSTKNGEYLSFVGYRKEKAMNGTQKINFGGKYCKKQFEQISKQIFQTLGVCYPMTAGFQNIKRDFNGFLNSKNDNNKPNKNTAQCPSSASTYMEIYLLNENYGCMCKNVTVTCQNGGYPNPNGCNRCICPNGLKGKTCSTNDGGTENTGKTIKVDSETCKTLEASIGINNNITYKDYKNTWYLFTAPYGNRVQLIFFEVKGDSKADNCANQGVEMKLKDFSQNGKTFCGNDTNFVSQQYILTKSFTSQGQSALIQLYSKRNVLNLIVKYRFLPDYPNRSLSPDYSIYPPSCEPTLDCRDFRAVCFSFVTNKSRCYSDSNWFYNTDCAATCNINECKCRNIRNDCEELAAKGECIKNPSMMNRDCRWSCKLCGNNLCEDSIDCKNYPKEFCIKNETMISNCPKTCKRCGI